MTDKLVVLVTCANRSEAARLARALVERRAAACVNILPGQVQSIYRWKGKIKEAREVLLLIKSSRKTYPALRTLVQRLHSYDVPEIIALPIVEGPRDYLKWMESCLAGQAASKSARKRKPRKGARP